MVTSSSITTKPKSKYPEEISRTYLTRRHLEGYNPADFDGRNFDVLITSSFNFLKKRSNKSMIMQKYLNAIQSQTRRNSTVFFVVESLSRYLETILMIEDIADSENLESKYRYVISSSVK